MANLTAESGPAENVVNFAIIGTGAMGQEHIRNLKILKGAVVVAVADTDEKMRSEAQVLLPEAIIIGDYKQLCAIGVRIDAIVLATPNFTHIDILREIIPWRKNILVEKVRIYCRFRFEVRLTDVEIPASVHDSCRLC